MWKLQLGNSCALCVHFPHCGIRKVFAYFLLLNDHYKLAPYCLLAGHSGLALRVRSPNDSWVQYPLPRQGIMGENVVAKFHVFQDCDFYWILNLMCKGCMKKPFRPTQPLATLPLCCSLIHTPQGERPS